MFICPLLHRAMTKGRELITLVEPESSTCLDSYHRRVYISSISPASHGRRCLCSISRLPKMLATGATISTGYYWWSKKSGDERYKLAKIPSNRCMKPCWYRTIEEIAPDHASKKAIHEERSHNGPPSPITCQ
ncbi:hypothetical protein HAX54_040973 [Datura stramonium]|uniref:Uncharacterized protein n=1 Tax=Datura stramonium TaxID=4076 RepID=A0ABS8VPQ1_DATST|nr:hypothetical protein [Datura stramonium]